jgi:hypothetical protein
MAELLRFVPANEDDYPSYPAIELHLQDESYHVITVNVAGETEEKAECFNLFASLAYMTCVLARMPEIEYVVDTLN